MSDAGCWSGPSHSGIASKESLGRGAMGVVYRARDLTLGRPVAIKFLSPLLANELGIARFRSEIQLAASLHHPNIVSIYESGEAADSLYYVMAFLGGETLRARLRREKQLSIRDALAITREVAAGLQHAHNRGIIHRDIKPENIVLVDGRACIVDFGLASVRGGSRPTADRHRPRRWHATLSESWSRGSAEPEIGPATDQYALACMMYEMLVGEPPFTGPTASAIVYRHMTDAPVSPRRRRPTVPAPLDEALLRALEKVPADRFCDVTEFVGALEQPRCAAIETDGCGRHGASRWQDVGLARCGNRCCRFARDCRRCIPGL